MTDLILNRLESALIRRHPTEAANTLQQSTKHELKEILNARSTDDLVQLIDLIPVLRAAEWVRMLAPDLLVRLFGRLETPKAAEIILSMDKKTAKKIKSHLPEEMVASLKAAMTYPANQAGSVMDRRIIPLNDELTVGDTIAIIKEHALRTLRVLFVVDSAGRLIKYIDMQKLLLAEKNALIRDIAKPIVAFIHDTDNRDDVLKLFDEHRLTDLPVVDFDNKFIGVIRYKAIVQSFKDNAATDLQTMVGVSKEERALTSPYQVVLKRLPWLQINLLTAFLAAAVVGVFEGLISKVTALAVLLPVVAGQSGNTGAQALAVTMRGLFLREIYPSQWFRLIVKELCAGFLNGLAVAIVTGVFVYIWSGSLGLFAIIFISMVVSMMIAAVSGASIPLILMKFGMDPAQSSSIILTTVTDVAGFFSFLGIASLLLHTIPVG